MMDTGKRLRKKRAARIGALMCFAGACGRRARPGHAAHTMLGGLPFPLAAIRAVAPNPGTRSSGPATFTGRQPCMVNSQRRAEPGRRAAAGAPIESLSRTEFPFGSDDVPPASGRHRGPAHLSGQRREPAPRALSVELLYAGRPVPATGLAVPFPQGLPLSPVFVNDKIQTL